MDLSRLNTFPGKFIKCLDVDVDTIDFQAE